MFREGVCSTFMPWSPELPSGLSFQGRIEGVSLDAGSIARTCMTPIVFLRTRANIGHSPLDAFYANYVLSGELKVEQAGRTSIARQGDLVIYDSSLPVALTERASGYYEDIAILIPKSRFAALADAEDLFANRLITQSRMLSPLAECFRMLNRRARSLSELEWISLLNACTALMPVAAGGGSDLWHHEQLGATDGVFRDVLAFIDRHLPQKELSAAWVARQFELAHGYVHRLFAMRGTTLPDYVLSRRLEQIRAELLADEHATEPIESIVARWGIDDISGFSGAFTKRYGLSPSALRAR